LTKLPLKKKKNAKTSTHKSINQWISSDSNQTQTTAVEQEKVKPNPDVKPQNTEVNRAETEKARNHNEDNGQKGISSKDPKSEDLKKGDEYYSPEDKSRPYKSSQNFRERPNNKYGQDNRKYEGGDNKQYYNNQDKEKSGDIKYDEEDYGYEEDRGGNDKKKGIIIKTIIRTITRTTIKGIIRVIITNNKEVVIMKNLINNPSKNTTSLNKSKLFMLRSQILQTRLNNLINLIFY